MPRNARACPGCGADERSGWDEEGTRYDGLDLPDEAFDEQRTPARRKLPVFFWPLAGLVTLAAVIAAWVIR